MLENVKNPNLNNSNKKHSDGYKPNAIPHSLKVIKGRGAVTHMVENELSIKLIELDELKLVGIRVVCPGDEYVNEIPKAFDQMRKRIGEITHLTSDRLIGVYKPGDFSEEEDGYWVCVEVEDHTIVPKGMVHLTVSPQRYTMINHRGPVAEIFKTYEESHKMMSAGGYKRLLRAWHLEIYETNRSVASNEVDVDLYNVIE